MCVNRMKIIAHVKIFGAFWAQGTDFVYFFEGLYIFLEAKIARSLGFDKDFYFLERFLGDIFYVFAGVEIMMIFSYISFAKMFPNSFW